MEDTSVFKVAIPTNDVRQEVIAVFDPAKGDFPIEGKSSLPPSLYQDANQEPLVVKELGLGGFSAKLGIAEQSREIDSFIIKEMKRQDLPDSTTSYKKIINDFLKDLQITDETDPFLKISKLRLYVNLQEKLFKEDREDNFLDSDPTTLNAKDFKRFMELKYGHFSN